MDVVGLIYILDDDSSDKILNLRGDLYKYLVKVRRHKLGDKISFRNHKDISMIYHYKIIDISSRSLSLELSDSEIYKVDSDKKLHIAWCIIDSKSVEKVLASLSEIGVDRISFIGCDRSQKNFKLDFKRYNRILEASMQQCGRSTYIKFDMFKNIEDFIKEFPDTKVFDFTQKTIDDYSDIKTVLIGCEGGFSPKERELLKKQEVFRLNTPMVLRSESAAMAIAAKVIL
jgi:16S rRNA (uracil1498-N3)-methyltransferase